MAPKKSQKARGKARAHRTPSPSPPLSLRLACRRGRRAGAVTYSPSELRLLLKLVRKYRPRSASDWAAIEAGYNTSLVRMPKPTGNPEANLLHEQAVEIDRELEGMEYTRVLDDSPPAAPPLSQSRVAATVEHKAAPAPTFRAVTRKAHPGSRPVQSRNPLDAATAHLASILSPFLLSTIPFETFELSCHRSARGAMPWRTSLTRRSDIVPSRSPVLSSEVLRLSSNEPFDEPFWSKTPPRRTSGEAHPSWMPGPPPERSDASGSGIRRS